EGLVMNRSNITLRGSGPERTRLLKDPVVNWFPVICLGIRWSGDKYMEKTYDLASDGIKGSKTIHLETEPDPPLSASELVLIDQLTNDSLTKWSPDSPPGDPSREWFCRSNRPVSQIVEVDSVSGTTVFFSSCLHIDFLTEYSAQLSCFGEDWMGPEPRPATRWSGIEDLYVEKGSAGNINLVVCAYCWVRNVESKYSDGESIDLTSCFRCEIRDSYIHTTDNPNPGGGGYLLSLSRGSADNLIENNAIWNGNKLMVMRATGGGNVIGYNYFEDAWISYQTGWVESGANASHMTTAHYELFEGNQAFNFDGESTWGNAVYVTVLRNHFTSKRRSIPPLQLSDEGFPRAVSLHHGHWWYTFAGNVLGYEGMDPWPYTSYAFEVAYPWHTDVVGMWALGMGEDWGPADPQVSATVFRHGNYDYVTNTVRWEPDIPDHVIPNSLYLEKKPAFFGNSAWPWVEPEGETKLYALPARDRFDAIHGLNPAAKKQSDPVIQAFTLRCMPNPFNSVTRIKYNVNGYGISVPVKLSVFNINGALITDLVNRPEMPGEHVVAWNASEYASGVYFLRLQDGDRMRMAKVILVK
ncbi:T9SS type A sorting domain-containing protein, partial [candidate division KSB1 bacterium]|nr:T9SS type A sorting domain-containing protein [candidate division KSB1 bacterium]